MLNVYITDLAAYNSGILSGKWIKLPMDSSDLSKEITAVLHQGEIEVEGYNHEEWFITDYDWEVIPLFEVGEYEDIFKLNNNLILLEEFDELQLKAIKFLFDERTTCDIEDAISRSEDIVIYENQTLEDIAYNLIEECYGVDKLPTIISNNIDYEGIARELELSSTYHIVDIDVIEYIS